jgi:iron complex transport system permease protein
MERRLKQRTLTAAFIAAAVFFSLLAVCVGSVRIRLSDIPAVLISHISGGRVPLSVDKATDIIIWTMRIPRVLLAFTVGASLGVSGVVIQAVLRNPLASA